ncbi:MAG: Fe-S protein assembly co-chaperone HscB [Chitinophagaceae bacterium]|nr:MAG: Fe-S protein assembly co-chaperone HscB [Chitinophagaceae bacterium]
MMSAAEALSPSCNFALMNYFELFGFPEQFRIDKEALRRRFFELSRQYHPDYFAQSGDEVQADALEKAAQLNKAYKTLGNDDERTRYLLEQKGLLQADEKYALAPDFLMEMMDLNEAVPEALADEGAKERLLEQLQTWKTNIYAPVAQTLEADSAAGLTEKELLQVKEYYYRKKYLQRLASQLGQKL